MDSERIHTIRDDWKEAIARTMFFERKLRGLSQRALARRAVITRQNLSRAENGKRGVFAPQTLESLAHALNLAPWELVQAVEARALLISIRRTRRAERLQKAS
jgi:transcriptional regulator with XRE-family HTH domain